MNPLQQPTNVVIIPFLLQAGGGHLSGELFDPKEKAVLEAVQRAYPGIELMNADTVDSGRGEERMTVGNASTRIVFSKESAWAQVSPV